jgi:hypothetical protein
MPASPRSNGVQDHPGIPFDFPSKGAFTFAGIPKRANEIRSTSSAEGAIMLNG